MNNWKSAENFLSETKNNNLNQLITHTVYLDEAKELLNNIYIAKNKKTNFHYIKGTIKSY